MSTTATLGFDGDDFELRILDRLLMESIPIIDYPSNYATSTTSSSETFINSLEIVKITNPGFLKKLLQTTSSSCCAICTDDFDVNENLTQLPYCRHWFHYECILPWLQRKNTCPLCRHELFVIVGVKELDDMMDIDIDIDIITQNQQFFPDFEEAEDERIIMEMLEEGLNERESMERDFSNLSHEHEQPFSGFDIITQNQQFFSNFEEAEDEEERIIMEMLEEGLNERESVERDFSIISHEYEQSFSGFSMSEEELQQAIAILSESSLNESRDNMPFQ